MKWVKSLSALKNRLFYHIRSPLTLRRLFGTMDHLRKFYVRSDVHKGNRNEVSASDIYIRSQDLCITLTLFPFLQARHF